MSNSRLTWPLWLVLPILGPQASCTVGPDYQRPKVAAPDHWKEATPGDQTLRGDWWEDFRDPLLSELVRKAFQANQTMALAVGQVSEAEGSLRLAAAQQYPWLALNPSAERERIFSGLSTDSFTTRSHFQLPLNLSYELDVWGRVRRAVESAQASYQASVADYEVVKLGVASTVAQTWITLRHVDLDRQLLRETVSLRQQTLDLVQARFRNGVASALEVAQAKIDLSQAQSDAAGLDRSRALFEHALAVLTGEPAQTFSVPDRALDIALPRLPSLLPSELLERRPDVAEAERRMMAANASIGVAISAYFPAINLTGLLGTESNDIRHMLRRNNLIWSVGGSVSAPLFQGGAVDAGVDVARAQYVQSVAAYRQTVLVAFQEVEDALSSLAILARQAQAQDDVVKSAQDATALARRRYEEGLASLLDLLDAQRSLLGAQRAANLIYRERLLSCVLLLRALGGGWQPKP